MKRIRIGKDISMRWEITTGGVAIPLEGRDLTVEIKSPMGVVSGIPYEVSGNTLIITYYGTEQKRVGEYSVTLWENKGKTGQNVVDVIRAFELVRTSQEENDFVGGDLQIESVDLGTENFDILTEGVYRGINIDTLQAEALEDSVNINGKTYSNESFTITLPKANLDSAGVMSADDKQTLQDHGNRISQINSKLDEHTESISQINTELNTKDSEITQINNTLGEHTQRINANITTDRIEDGAVTSEKIATSAFDDTLSVNGKVAPADVVGEKITELQTEINGKQEALTLTVKDNGNIVLANIQGQSKEFMPATPSGDPMHYAYVAAGAEYNDTGKDIVRSTPWASIVDDPADQTVVHKAGYWYLNGLGDITNEQMNNIYSQTNNLFEPSNNYAGLLQKVKCRVNLYKGDASAHLIRGVTDFNSLTASQSLEVLYLGYSSLYPPKPKDLGAIIRDARSVYMIYCLFNCINLVNIGDVAGYATALKYMWLKNLKLSVKLNYCPKFANCCILYMIQNVDSTSVITITLHADAYARAMANANIVAALEAHPNVSLASA